MPKTNQSAAGPGGLFDDWQADIGVAAPLSYRAPDNSSRGARFLFSLSSAFKLCRRGDAVSLSTLTRLVAANPLTPRPQA